MPAALPIAIGVSAGTSLLGASKASKASKEAAQTQVAASQDAMRALAGLKDETAGIYGQGYAGAAAPFAPYARLGVDSLANLYKGMGMGPMPNYTPGVGYQPNATDQGMARRPMGGGAPRLSTMPVGAPMTLGGVYGMGQPGGMVGGGMVMLRAPNGQTKAVPAGQVEGFVARGATRV